MNINTSSTKKEADLDKKLEEIRARQHDDAYQAKAQSLGLPFSDLSKTPIDHEALSLVTEEQARSNNLAVIYKSGTDLTIATTEPESIGENQVIKDLENKGFNIHIVMTSASGLSHAWQRYESNRTVNTFEIGSIDINEKDLDELQARIGSLNDLQQQVSSVSITKLLEILLAGALKIEASDIHFEPGQDSTRLRYRLDGMLQDVTSISSSSYLKIVDRIKVLSHLKLNIKQAPQDGRFTIKRGDKDIEVRVSILPSEFGETIVMRLLDPGSIEKIANLGMRPEILALVKEYLDKPTGAILTTGPTGSGKTTTLYSFVQYLNSTGNKIITIEDPIEYHLAGISQTQVEPDKGYTFANGLRAIVRQDPDIILVGEIRDGETAEIALHAALTGHLVLSTIHTNDAAGTIPRLIDLKIAPQIIAPAIRLAMAQRLVRTLCLTCRNKRKAKPEELDKIKGVLGSLDIYSKISSPENIELYDPVGCEKCNSTGYKGRIGVFEVLKISPAIEKLIMGSPAISDIQELALEEGMITMKQDAYLKLLEGETTIEEIERILG